MEREMAQPSLPKRSNRGLLQSLERPALLWLVRHIPGWVTPNILTGVGFIGACIAAASYWFSSWHPEFLWLATIGLLINWYGDSLDGTLARFRQIERPRYGYFLDQNLDAFAQLLLAAGFGLSGYIRFEITMFAAATFFLLSISSLVQAIVSDVFELTCYGIGLTEIRVGFSALNALMFFFPPTPLRIAGLWLTYPEVLALVWAGSMLIIFVFGTKAGLKDISAEEVSGRS